MGTVNRVILIGNLGADAEFRVTGGGNAVARFRIATTETYKGRDGEKKSETEWHRINFWGKSAEALQQYLTKGKQVYVEGRLQTRKWQDKDGQDRYTTEVKADRVVLLGSAGGGGPRRENTERDDTAHEPAGSHDAPVSMPGDDEVPF
jgi:single-strand DNA-binding protein